MRTYIVIDENNKEILRDKNLFRVRDLIVFRRRQGKFDRVMCKLSLPDGYNYTKEIPEEEYLNW